MNEISSTNSVKMSARCVFASGAKNTSRKMTRGIRLRRLAISHVLNARLT